MLTMCCDWVELWKEGAYGIIPTFPNEYQVPLISFFERKGLSRWGLTEQIIEDYAYTSGIARHEQGFPYYVDEPNKLIFLAMSESKNNTISYRAFKEHIQILRLAPYESFVMDIDLFTVDKSTSFSIRPLYDLFQGYFDDRFTLTSETEEHLPWKGKEACIKCGFKVDDWSAKHRLCLRCGGASAKTRHGTGSSRRVGSQKRAD